MQEAGCRMPVLVAPALAGARYDVRYWDAGPCAPTLEGGGRGCPPSARAVVLPLSELTLATAAVKPYVLEVRAVCRRGCVRRPGHWAGALAASAVQYFVPVRRERRGA